MGAAWLVLADAGLPGRPQLFDPRLIWSAAGFVGVCLLGALLIAWLDRWRKRLAEEKPTPHDQLTSFRALYEQGELSQEEYDRIKARLTSRLRPETQAPAPPVNPPPPPPSEAPPAGS